MRRYHKEVIMKHYIHVFLSGILGALLCTSVSANERDSYPSELPVWNEQIEDMASRISHAMADDAFRYLVMDQISRRFDCDYDVLYRNFALSKLPSGQTVHQYLATLPGTLSEIPSIASLPPALQVSVTNGNAWKPAYDIPEVAAITYGPTGSEAINTVLIHANDHSSYTVAMTDEPQQATVVVALSERVDIGTGKLYAQYASCSSSGTTMPEGDVDTTAIEVLETMRLYRSSEFGWFNDHEIEIVAVREGGNLNPEHKLTLEYSFPDVNDVDIDYPLAKDLFAVSSETATVTIHVYERDVFFDDDMGHMSYSPAFTAYPFCGVTSLGIPVSLCMNQRVMTVPVPQ